MPFRGFSSCSVMSLNYRWTEMLPEGEGPGVPSGLGSARLTQHPGKHRSERPSLLAVDQKLARLRVLGFPVSTK